jgi:hypothetical protein
MKNIIGVILLTILVASCKKNSGIMKYKGKFTADKMIVKETNSDTL